ncbi:MAG: hypothetical protein RI571_15340, partial [Roseovarius sp.]|nr:hypothetical protein [Roseovarius sp.]
MQASAHGTVTALEYRTCPDLDFADIVEEFDIAFRMVDATKRSLTWDCEDIAIIERDNLRVCMGWLPPEQPGAPWYLVVAVGPTARDRTTSQATFMGREGLDYLTDRIIERTSEFLPADAVMRGEAGQPVGPDLIDNLLELLRHPVAGSDAPPVDDPRTERPGDTFAPEAEPVADETLSEPVDANPAPRSVMRRFGLSDMDGLAPVLSGAASRPLRLSIHTFALTLM